MKLTPNGHYARYSDGLNGGMRWLTARLYREGGSWWLEYEDGTTLDTRHQANGKTAYRKADMLKIIRSNPTPA